MNPFRRLHTRLDELQDTMVRHNALLERQSDILERHERRSTQLEERFRPIEAHVERWAGAWKLITVLATLAALGAAVWKVL